MKLITQLILSMIFVHGLSAQCILVCNNDVEVALDSNGEATITAATVLEPSVPCINEALIQIENSTSGVIYPAAPSIDVTCLDRGNYVARTVIMENGVIVNSCWTLLSIVEGAANCVIDIPVGHIRVDFEATFSGPYVNQVYLNGNLIQKHSPFDYSIDPANIVTGENIITFDALTTGPNGITTLDLINVKKAITIDNFVMQEGDIGMIAADIDNNLFVGVGDLVKSRNIILGIDVSGSSFFYVQEDVTDFGGLDPFDFGQNVYEFRFMDTDLPALELTFNPYQGGDVNGSFGFTGGGNPSVDRSLDINLSYTDRYLEKGDIVEVAFTLEENNIEGLQMAFDLEGVKVLNSYSNYDANELKTNETGKQIRLSYFPEEADDDFAFTLEVEAQKSGMLSDALNFLSSYKQELVQSNLAVKNIVLVENSPTSTKRVDTQLFELSPNPISTSAQITLGEELSGEYSIIVRDLNGKSVFTDRSSNSSYTLDRSVLPFTGMYLLTISQNDQVDTQKLMVK